MASAHQIIAEAIDTAPLNRGLKGADWLAHAGNVPIVSDAGDVTLFDYQSDGIYEIHVLYVSRGREAIKQAVEAIRIMFERQGASLIFAMAPIIRPEVRLLARWAGMRSAGLRDTTEGLCELFVLSKFQWKVARS